MATFVYLLFAMIFFHILDDFCLQSCWLVNGKQRGWWEKNAPNPMYKHDYIVALLVHGFSWSFMIMVPVAVYLRGITTAMVMMIIANALIHAVIDDQKANHGTINLIIDQLCHMVQILSVWLSIGGVVL